MTRSIRSWVGFGGLGGLVAVVGVAACSGAGGLSPNRDDAGGPRWDALAGDARGTHDVAADAGAPRRDAAGDSGAGAGGHPDASAAGAPVLAALSVSAAAGSSASITLEPAFSPEIHDYAIRCSEGTTSLVVTMRASSGAETLLVQPTLSPSLPSQTLSVKMAENQALVAAATDGTATASYWVRCLPHDFPQTEWTLHADAGVVTPGYYLVGTALPSASGCYAMVLDRNGVAVWYARSEPEPVLGWCVFDVDTVASGTISFDSVADTTPGFELHDLATSATTTLGPAATPNVDLHELRALANGNYLVISSPIEQGIDVTGMNVEEPDGGTETLSGVQPILACTLVEFRPDGSVAWTWTATDHFDAVADSVNPLLIAVGPSTDLVLDPFHCNSVDEDPKTGNLLVSARQMNAIFYVERASGRVLWKMGGAPASKDGAAYVTVDDPFALQHDARLLPGWSAACGGTGQVSLFDDEALGKPAPARAAIYDVRVGSDDGGSCGGGAGTAPGTATLSWQRTGTAPSSAMGSFRISADRSRVIGWGLIAGAGFTEVDANGDDLADLTFADGNTSYRAIKVPLSTFDLDALRRSAGVP